MIPIRILPSITGFWIVLNLKANQPQSAVESIPAFVLKKIFAEIILPYLFGFVVFYIIVIEAVCQLSANKYLKHKQTIESQKLSVRRNMPNVKGIDKSYPMTQTQAIVIGDLAEYLSQISPPIIEEINPKILRLIAFAEANSFCINGNTY